MVENNDNFQQRQIKLRVYIIYPMEKTIKIYPAPLFLNFPFKSRMFSSTFESLC